MSGVAPKPAGQDRSAQTGVAAAPSANRERLLQLAARLDEKRFEFESKKDERAIFAFTYVEITRSLAASIDTFPFQKPEWIVALAEAFAAQYFAALAGPPSESWLVVFAAIRRRSTSVAENMIFSITAHIVHDLPVALSNLGQQGTLDPHIGDFHAMNEVLAKNIVAISEGVTKRYEPFFARLENFQQHEVQILTNYGFRLARGMAWYNMVRLTSSDKHAVLDSLDKNVKTVIDSIRKPPYFSVAIIFRLLRLIASFSKRWPKPRPLKSDGII
jgi:hypothetical protein